MRINLVSEVIKMVNFMYEERRITAGILGEIDHHNAAMMRRKIDMELKERLPEEMVFDFEHVTFMDSSGIALLLRVHRHVTGYGGTPVDFCFSEHCQKELRTFLKGRYGSLERLNEEWETEFPDWEAVVPFTRQEVWAANGRHVAGWADHLEFMDSRLTNSVAFSTRAMHAADPAVRFALSGTQAPSAYGGMDWWKILGVMDAALNYGSGGQFDIHRSFCPGGGLMPWSWGYAGRGGDAVAPISPVQRVHSVGPESRLERRSRNGACVFG